MIGCDRSEEKFCEERESVPLEVQISGDSKPDFPHFQGKQGEFLIGTMVSVFYEVGVMGDGEDVFINDTVYSLADDFTLPAGEYGGLFKPHACFIISDEGYTCDCRGDELRTEFFIEFFDTAQITIDSLLLTQSTERVVYKASVKETAYYHANESYDLGNGVDFSYRFTSAPQSSIVTLILENMFSGDEEVYEFIS